MSVRATFSQRLRSPTIAQLLEAGQRPLYSFEFFPPKDEVQLRQLWRTVRELESLGPDFVSVTYGASGSTRERTIKATESIALHTTLRSVAHLTCASQSRDQLRQVIGSYAAAGIRHVLAIRGDMPGGPRVPWESHPTGLNNATELVALVRELGDFCVGVAAFPEPHPEKADPDLDARILADKARAGASFAITQLFFTAQDYFDLVARTRALGCEIPILPGIMPITNLKQLTRFAELSGAALPETVVQRVQRGRRRRGSGAPGGDRDRHRAGRDAIRRRGPRTALLHPEQVVGYPRDLRQSASGPASSVISR